MISNSSDTLAQTSFAIGIEWFLWSDHVYRMIFPSMDWFKGKSAGNHGFSPEILDFPVIFPLNQSIDSSTIASHVWSWNSLGTSLPGATWATGLAPMRGGIGYGICYGSHGKWSTYGWFVMIYLFWKGDCRCFGHLADLFIREWIKSRCPMDQRPENPFF